jgi:uncharacterized protein
MVTSPKISEALTGRIVIAGGSGFLGLNLAQHLSDRGAEVVILSRTPPKQGPWQHHFWDGYSIGPWHTLLDGTVALVNLAGRSVDCRKTPERCDEILRSRVESTRVLGQALRQVANPPSVWVQMSTAHRYGDALDRVCDEDAAFGYGLAPFVGAAWEDAYAQAILPQMRQVIVRTSFVLGRSGGALPQLARMVRWGLGGHIGHGRQGMSWIHEMDMNRLFVRGITDAQMQGAYIATAPNPVTNAEFMRTLRRVLHRPIGLPAAAWMVRFGARWLLNTDPELALYGRFCVSKRLAQEGFVFTYPDLSAALTECLR